MRSKQQLAALLTQSANAIAIMDPTGQVCEWNPAAVALLGWPRLEMLDAARGMRLPARDPLAYADAWARIQAGEVVQPFRSEFRTAEGGTVELLLQLWVVLDGEEFDGVVAVMTTPKAVGGARDRAGELRDHLGEERDEVGEQRDIEGERRDRAGDRRDDAGQRRDDAGILRDDEAVARDRSAAHRDVSGAARDLVGDQRDERGLRRDQASEQRDAVAELRDQVAEHIEARRSWGRGVDHDRPSAVARREAASDRREAQRDRGAGATERSASGHDRSTASADRKAGESQRHEAEHDRSTASADRGAGAVDRARSRGDRRTSMADRGAGASERTESEADRDIALADRGASARDRENASVDDLTGAHRREAGFVELDREILRAQRTDQGLVVAFVDVDALKAINDNLGHAAGDRVLVTVTDALRGQLRDHDLVIRYGGDEFVCVFPGVTLEEADDRLACVDSLLAACDPPASITVGLAALQPDEVARDLIARADAELYAIRHRKRGA